MRIFFLQFVKKVRENALKKRHVSRMEISCVQSLSRVNYYFNREKKKENNFEKRWEENSETAWRDFLYFQISTFIPHKFQCLRTFFPRVCASMCCLLRYTPRAVFFPTIVLIFYLDADESKRVRANSSKRDTVGNANYLCTSHCFSERVFSLHAEKKRNVLLKSALYKYPTQMKEQCTIFWNVIFDLTFAYITKRIQLCIIVHVLV